MALVSSKLPEEVFSVNRRTYIGNIAGFQEAVSKSLPMAEDGILVAFGIVPERLEVGYRYIRGGKIDSKFDTITIDKFVEKHDFQTAEYYVKSGDYYWNSGMSMFRASRYLDELETHRPDIFTACKMSMSSVAEDVDFIRVDKQAFLDCPAESIDYAVMQKK